MPTDGLSGTSRVDEPMTTDPDGFHGNHMISWRKIREFLQAHPEDPSAGGGVRGLVQTAEGKFRHFGDVKKVPGQIRSVT